MIKFILVFGIILFTFIGIALSPIPLMNGFFRKPASETEK